MQPYLKFTLSFFSCLLTCFTAYAQRPSSLSLTYSLSGDKQIHMIEDLVHHPHLTEFKSSPSHSFGIRYLLKSPKAVTLETGIEFLRIRSKREVVIPYTNHSYAPLMVVSPDRLCDILTIPVYANIAFLKHFFFNGGLLMDTNLNKEHQNHSGLGAGFGLGAQYNYKKINLFLNPFLKSHSLIAYKGNPHTVTIISVKAGVGYTF